MSGIIVNNVARASGTIAATPGGLDWSADVVTASTVTVEAGRGYFINTTSNACTVTLPASPEVGDQIVLADYARTWATNAVTLDSNGNNFQGEADTYTVDYDTVGQSLNIVYADSTKGWLPVSDDAVAFDHTAPSIQRGIFAFGSVSGSAVNTKNLINSSGVVSGDTSSTGTARYNPQAATYGGDKAIFAYGATSGNSAQNMSNLVSNEGVVASDTSGVGTARYILGAASYGTDKAIFAFGSTAGDAYVNLSNLVSNQGVVATDATGVGTAREEIDGCSYGDGNAIFGYGMNNTAGDYQNVSNKVNSSGVVASDTSGVGTARKDLMGANYGNGTLGMFVHGATGSYLSIKNLVNASGVVAADSTASGTNTSAGSSRYGGDKAIICFGRTANGSGGLTSNRSLISNTGVVADSVSGAGTAKSSGRAAGYGYTA